MCDDSLPCTGMAWSGSDKSVLTVSADKTTRFTPIRPTRSSLRAGILSLLLTLVMVAVIVWLVRSGTLTSNPSGGDDSNDSSGVSTSSTGAAAPTTTPLAAHSEL